MKNLFGIALFLTFSLLSFQPLAAQPAEVDEASIKEKFKQYMQHSNAGEWDQLMDMLNPDLFKLVTKDQMIQMFAQMEMMGIKPVNDKFEVKNISAPIDTDSLVYVTLDYEADGRIEISNDELLKDGNREQLLGNLEKEYGEGNITYDEEKKEIQMAIDRTMVARSNKGQSNWTFIEYNANNPMQAAMLEQVLPDGVIEKLNE